MNQAMTSPDISVIVPTRNRAVSLAETLTALRGARRDGLSVEVVVVSNGSEDDTPAVAASFASEMPLRYLEEPRTGKAHALNRAIDEGHLGRLVAILDDDMTPDADWFQGVAAISARHPLHAFFTGRTLVRWPVQQREPWTEYGALRGWAFSSSEGCRRDVPIRPGFWATGNHFWVRRCVFDDGRRFAPIWLTEPWFMLQLQEQGLGGMMGPDAVVWHRIQPGLLSRDAIEVRAIRVGRGFANVRMRCRWASRQGTMLNASPLAMRCLCLGGLAAWTARRVLNCFEKDADRRFARRVAAMERMANYGEMLRISRQVRREWRGESLRFPDYV